MTVFVRHAGGELCIEVPPSATIGDLIRGALLQLGVVLEGDAADAAPPTRSGRCVIA